MVAQAVKQAVRVGGDAGCRERDHRTQRRRRAFQRNLVEQLFIDVGVEGGIVLHQIGAGFDVDRFGRARHLKIDLHAGGHHRPDLHILRVWGKSLSCYRHVIGIERHVREREVPLTVSRGGPVIPADRLMNLNRRVRNYCARRV